MGILFSLLALVAFLQSSVAYSIGNSAVYLDDQPSLCLPDVRQSIDRLNPYGKYLRFVTTAQYPSGTQRPPLGLLNGSFMRHIQGVARLKNSNFLAMSGNASGGAYLYMVQMASQPSVGDWKSNVSCSGNRCSSPARDRIVSIVHLSQKFPHPGGIQALGDVLAIGVDSGEGKPSEIRFYDVRNPYAPKELEHLKILRSNRRAETVGLTKVSQGKFRGKYVVVVGSNQTKHLTFYLSNGSDLNDPRIRFEKHATWETKGNVSLPNYQALNLIEQCDGRLFLFGTYKSKPLFGLPWGGKDWVDSYTVDLGDIDVKGYKIDKETGNFIPLILPFKNKHMTLKKSFLAAGGGIYVDEVNRELKVYATDYWPLNPISNNSVIRFEEFEAK